MILLLKVILGVGILCFIQSYDALANNHNISGVRLLDPTDSRVPLNSPISIFVRFQNTGLQDETDVQLTSYVVNKEGKVIFTDTITVNSWMSGKIKDTSVGTFMVEERDTYFAYVIAHLSTDENRADDTLSGRFYANYDYDIAATFVTNPRLNDTLISGISFQPTGRFQQLGGKDASGIPASALIFQSSNGKLVFESDSLLPRLLSDSPSVSFSFPSTQGSNDMRNLAPGAYIIRLIANDLNEGDPTNDTASSTFYIADVSSVSERTTQATFTLEQNHPNPFRSSTTIAYTLPEAGHVSLRIMDIAGRTVKTELKNDLQSAEAHSVTVNLSPLPAGVYFYAVVFTNLQDKTTTFLRRMIFLPSEK